MADLYLITYISLISFMDFIDSMLSSLIYWSLSIQWPAVMFNKAAAYWCRQAWIDDSKSVNHFWLLLFDNFFSWLKFPSHWHPYRAAAKSCNMGSFFYNCDANRMISDHDSLTVNDTGTNKIKAIKQNTSTSCSRSRINLPSM